MELGGKSALIVFDDADVEKAVEWAMVGAVPAAPRTSLQGHTSPAAAASGLLALDL